MRIGPNRDTTFISAPCDLTRISRPFAAQSPRDEHLKGPMLTLSPTTALLAPTPRNSDGLSTSGRKMESATLEHLALRRRTKAAICEDFIAKLRKRGDVEVDAQGFAESVRRHFDLLPSRYSLDVNLDSLDVLSHKRLLDEARADPSAVSFAVRPVEIIVPRRQDSSGLDSPASPAQVEPAGVGGCCAVRPFVGGGRADPCPALSPQSSRMGPADKRQAGLPKPAFGSSPNLQVLAPPSCGGPC